MDTFQRPRIPALLCLAVSLAACGGGGDSYLPKRVARPTAASLPLGGLPEPSAVAQVAGSPHALAAPEPSPWNTEQYAPIAEAPFLSALDHPLSTFSTDVDTASYANVRRFLTHGQRPPVDAVRVEELVNYFGYDYEAPSGEHPVAITSELADSPFDPRHKLLRIGLYARAAAEAAAPARNLVFLLDVSGSMSDPEKLPLVIDAMSMLTRTLTERDRIAIVVYAGGSGVVLPSTPGHDHARIEAALRLLSAGGSTHGSAGIELAYDLALQGLRPGAVNRVILATDGDFNVGVTDQGSLLRLIERRRAQGVYLTVLGVGMGNLKDATMELLADHGNGNYAYLDTLSEARKVLIDEASATLHTVAKDVKLQLEWNPLQVARYRLIGYENRRLRDEEFDDDAKDAGDLGDGHRVTALYELELAGAARTGAGAVSHRRIDPLKYQVVRAPSVAAHSAELVTIKLRYKRPEASESKLLSEAVLGRPQRFDQASDDLRFAAAVAGFGMLLRQSPYAGSLDFRGVARIARSALGRDALGHRGELLSLVTLAQEVYER
jgi:Ca-activated chloride channel family protein